MEGFGLNELINEKPPQQVAYSELRISVSGYCHSSASVNNFTSLPSMFKYKNDYDVLLFWLPEARFFLTSYNAIGLTYFFPSLLFSCNSSVLYLLGV